jgi:hypothetical protein
LCSTDEIGGAGGQPGGVGDVRFVDSAHARTRRPTRPTCYQAATPRKLLFRASFPAEVLRA